MRHYCTAHFQQFDAASDHREHGGVTHCDDDVGPYARKLRFQPRLTRGDLRFACRFVNASFAALFVAEVLHCAGDVYMLTLKACIGEGTVEQLASGSDERSAFTIFVIARLLPYKNDPSVKGTFTEHRLSRVFPQVTASTSMDGFAQNGKGRVC